MPPRPPFQRPGAALSASAFLLACVAGATQPQESFFMDYLPMGERGWDWITLHQGRMGGPQAVPYEVPPGRVLLVDQIEVGIRTPQPGPLGWRIPISGADGNLRFTLRHTFEVEAPQGQQGAFGVTDTAFYGGGVAVPPGSRIHAPCWDGHGFSFRFARFLGRLQPIVAPPGQANARPD